MHGPRPCSLGLHSVPVYLTPGPLHSQRLDFLRPAGNIQERIRSLLQDFLGCTKHETPSRNRGHGFIEVNSR
jgi:hypothetical protein